MKNIFPVIVVASILSAQIEFNEGPYGSEYFDIAGPYTLVDLTLEGADVNSDNTVNILDIIATVNYVLGFVRGFLGGFEGSFLKALGQ